MTTCCAFGCQNKSEDGIKLFRIPSGKNEKLRRKIWLAKIKGKNFKTCNRVKLCEFHFTPDQFEKTTPGKLKPSAVPTIFSYKTEEINDGHLSDQFKRKMRSRTKPNTVPSIIHYEPRKMNKTRSSNHLMKKILNKSKPNTSSPILHFESNKITRPNLHSPNKASSNNVSTIPHIIMLSPVEFNQGCNSFNRDCSPSDTDGSCSSIDQPTDLQESNKKLYSSLLNFRFFKNKLNSLKKNLNCVTKAKENLEKRLKTLFNPDQMQVLEKGTGYVKQWSNDTIEKAVRLHLACGNEGYDLLLDQGFPLPTQKTLYRRIHRVVFKNSILPDRFETLKTEVKSEINVDQEIKSEVNEDKEIKSEINEDQECLKR